MVGMVYWQMSMSFYGLKTTKVAVHGSQKIVCYDSNNIEYMLTHDGLHKKDENMKMNMNNIIKVLTYILAIYVSIVCIVAPEAILKLFDFIREAILSLIILSYLI